MCEKILLFITVEVISSSFILMTGKGRGKTPSHWTIKPESASVSCSGASCWVCSSHTSFGSSSSHTEQYLWLAKLRGGRLHEFPFQESFCMMADFWTHTEEVLKGGWSGGLLSVSPTEVIGGWLTRTECHRAVERTLAPEPGAWTVVSVLQLSSCVTSGTRLLPLWASASSSVESTLTSDDF